MTKRLLLVPLLALALAAPAAASTTLTGIPQRGPELGRAAAPALVVEFADVQCPYCAQWSRQSFPRFVRDYVRTGKVKLVWRGLAFLGPDSARGLRAVDAAAAQNKLWDLVEALYAVQGRENSGWVTDALLRRVGSGIPGLDVERMLRERGSPATQRVIDQAAVDANAARVQGTPTFYAGRPGGSLNRLALPTLEPAAFFPALRRALR
jgi:protein-disulfide isomerase